MKKSKILRIVFIAIALFIAGHFIYDICKHSVPDGYVLVEQASVDSLKAYIVLADSLEKIANLPPDTIKTTEIVYKDTTINVVTTPTPHQDPTDASITSYTDSLVNEEIDVTVNFDVAGKLASGIKWEYKPIIVEKETTVVKKEPYPVIENVYVPKIITGHYLSIAVGGNDKMFNFGLDYDMVKEKNIYGLQYRRYGEVNVYGVKIGINLSTLFKK